MIQSFDLWTWILDPVHGAVSALGALGVGYLVRILTKTKAPTSRLLDWAPDKVAHAYPADALRIKLDVPDGTKIILTDRAGVRQPVEFDPGPYTASQVDARLSKARIGMNSGAEALQYRTAPFDSPVTYSNLRSQDDFFDVEVFLNVNVRVDSRYPERLMTWHIAQDRQVTMGRVRSSIEALLRAPVTHAIRTLPLAADDFDLRLDEKKLELQGVLNEGIGQHGLLAMITSLAARSADFQAYRELWEKHTKEQRSAEIDALLRRARVQKAQGDAEAEEAIKTLIQEGDLRELARMEELENAKAYMREREEAKKVSAKENRESQGPRHQVLVELEKLRSQKKPFSIDLRILRPGAARDIAVHPPAYTAENRIGSPLQLSIESPIAGYLYLLNLGTTGKLWRLLPNPWRADNRIAAQRMILVPNGEFKLKFEDPPGTEVVMAIVSPSRVDSLERLPVNADGMSVSPEMAARDIKVVGQQLSGLSDWAEATLLIQTEPGQASSASASD